MGRAVPCCNFLNLLKLLTMLPGTRASILRQNMADITARSIAGDQDLAAPAPENPVRRNPWMQRTLSARSVAGDHALAAPAPENPVLRNPLMQLTAADFQSCRTTPDGLISIIDAIISVKGLRGKSRARWGPKSWPNSANFRPLESRWISIDFRLLGDIKRR